MNIREIARLAQVSPSTVSRVLNCTKPVDEDTRARVMAIVERAGYIPNSNKRHRDMVALVIPENFSARATWSAAILDGVMDGLGQHYVTLMRQTNVVDTSGKGAWKWRELVVRSGLRGVVFVQAPGSAGVLQDLRRARVPYVVFGRGDAEENWVWCDNSTVVSEALDLCYQAGHRRLAYVGPPPVKPDHRDRYDAYRTWVTRHGLEPVEVVVASNTAPLATQLAEILSKPGQVSAIFVADAEMAVSALSVVREMNLRIPQDLSFVSMGHHPLLLAWTPPLTLIVRRLRTGAKLAVEKLIEIAAGKAETPVQITLPSDLQVGVSVAPPGANGNGDALPKGDDIKK